MRRGRRRRASALAAALAVGAATIAPWPSNAAVDPTHPVVHRGRPTEHLSFKAPIDFATEASPSSTAFNETEGDQLGLILLRTPLSDSVATADFDDDGRADVAQTNVIAGTVSVFLGDGRGGFGVPQQHRVGRSPVFVAAGHLDLDEHLDLAVANLGSDEVSILRGDGKGSFLHATSVPVPAPRNVAIGDFNGDAVPDLAVASGAPAPATPWAPPMATAGGVAILVGVGAASGTFIPAQYLATFADDRPVNANFVAVGDFGGGDGDDLAVGVGISPNAGDRQDGGVGLTGDDVLVFLDREGGFDAIPDQRVGVGGWPTAIAVDDLDGDADPDLAVLDSSSGDITTLSGDGLGGFTVKATNVSVGSIPRSLSVADFDDDGLLDLVTASFTASTVSVLRGEGDGAFHPAVDFWSGDAPTGTAVGDFDGDHRLDVVVGRLRNDHLALLLNESPARGDGVVITRDVPYYGGPQHPTFAAHHTLDVYSPPKGTPSFAGSDRPYPVVFFAHGGGGISGDKSMVSYLMRSLAREGLVAVSINYRLGFGTGAGQLEDVVQAFGWVRDNVGSKEFGGDPDSIFVFGHSAGGGLVATLATSGDYDAERRHIRGLVLAGHNVARAGSAVDQPPSLLLNGDEGVERALAPLSVTFAADARHRGAASHYVVVPGRDHMTITSDMALDGDLGRAAMVNFMDSHL